MFHNRFLLGKLNAPTGLSGTMLRFFYTALLFIASFVLVASSSNASAECPDLTPYYPAADVNWPSLSQQLEPMSSECLESSEFYALLGAAKLNSGNIADAFESLERALLLEPENGGAQMDYAQALYLQGQLFSALEINDALLAREDLPSNLQAIILQREQTWRALTSERSAQLDILAGYDNNLNGAPDPSQLTLTLSGEPIVLLLNEEFRPKSGPYMNFRLGGRYRQLAADYQHNWLTELRGRLSEDSESDLLQVDSRYAFIKPGRRQSWQVSTGISHLQFGGSSLYTGADISARYQRASSLSCKPYYQMATQYQSFHNQRQLNALESKAGIGLTCPRSSSWGNHQFSTELSLLSNTATESERPGGDRNGWQASFDWQIDLPLGEFRSQLGYTQLNDTDGYSPLLANGAERWLRRSYLLLQYRRPLFEGTTLLVNMFHQDQRSNLELFQTVDSTIEIGISLAL
jgi:tetratricopeptide (TPR) repeat protein